MPQKPYVYQEYPKQVWDAAGNAKVAKDAEDAQGWLTRHPDDPRAQIIGETPKAASEAPEPPVGLLDRPYPPTREEVIAELRSRGVKFNPRAALPELMQKL